jgi:hypothetical protein
VPDRSQGAGQLLDQVYQEAKQLLEQHKHALKREALDELEPRARAADR